MFDNDEYFMKEALKIAKLSSINSEVPVGAIIVKDGRIISFGINRREKEKNSLCHADIEAIDGACKILGGWRLFACDLFVTLEPCPMCAGAIINSRIRRVVFGAYDKKAGSCGSVVNLFDLPYNHKPLLKGGVLSNECSNIISNFFEKLRRDKKL